MLWDLIRDFIVTHITGGNTSNGNTIFNGFGYGYYYNKTDGTYFDDLFIGGNDVFYKIGSNGNEFDVFVSASDWLATTLTIISLIFILVACVMFVVKIIKLVGNLVK